MPEVCKNFKRDCQTIWSVLKNDAAQTLVVLACGIVAAVLFALYMGASDQVYERWIRPGLGLVTVFAIVGFVIVMAMHTDLRSKR